jgi:phosphotransacetylase
MSQQSLRQAARRSALSAQTVLRKERADRERRLEALSVAVLTALGERDALVRGAERRAGRVLRTMSDEEGCRCGKRSTGAAAASLCER